MKTAARFDNGCDCTKVIMVMMMMMMLVMMLSACVYGNYNSTDIGYIRLG